MAKKKSGSSTASGTPELLIEHVDAEKQLRDRIAEGSAIIEEAPSTDKELADARQQYYTWDEYNNTLLGRIFSTTELAKEYSCRGIVVAGGPTSLDKKIRELVDDVTKKIRRLESIAGRLPLYTPNRGIAGSQQIPTSSTASTRSVFVVHGQNNEFKETVARYLSQLQLTPIILHELASAGRTIIEKFEANSDSCFAIILLTPDDLGCLAPASALDALNERARQNVIFEWGFFVGKLGRRNVCALVAEGVEMPSDMQGIVYVPLDQKGAWKMLLARELKAGDVDVDLNRVI